MYPRLSEASEYTSNQMFEVYEYLRERGLVHNLIGEPYCTRYHTLHDRFITE